MTPATLQYPVTCLDGKVLLAPGTPLTRNVLADISSRRPRTRRPERSLLRHGTVRRDLRSLTREGVYDVIFGNASESEELRRTMERTRVPLPVLEAVDYFREYDPYTYGHTLRVFALSCLLARRLGGREGDGITELMAGPLHDYGKICVPLSILRKSSPLQRSERDILEHHTLAGSVLLHYDLGSAVHPAAAVARDHHERKDGTGYPRGIRLRDRLVEIIAACDVYDALISPRPYRKKPFDNRTALEEITGMAEQGKIGWAIVRALVAYNRKRGAAARAVSREKRGTPPEGNFHGIVVDDAPARRKKT